MPPGSAAACGAVGSSPMLGPEPSAESSLVGSAAAGRARPNVADSPRSPRTEPRLRVRVVACARVNEGISVYSSLFLPCCDSPPHLNVEGEELIVEPVAWCDCACLGMSVRPIKPFCVDQRDRLTAAPIAPEHQARRDDMEGLLRVLRVWHHAIAADA